MPYRILSIDEVAERLHIPRREVEMLVRRKEIPFAQQGERTVFRKRDVEEWASQRILGLRDRRLSEYHGVSSEKRRKRSNHDAVMTELLRPEFIAPSLPSKTRASVLRDVVAVADHLGLVSDANDLVRGLEERERVCSTGLPGGLALLHPCHHDPYLFVGSFLVFCRTVQPIHFGTPDGKPADLFFMVCCQDDQSHLHTLARLCMMAMDTDLLSKLRQAPPDADAMYRCIIEAEEQVLKKR